jgi:hypothetical protein
MNYQFLGRLAFLFSGLIFAWMGYRLLMVALAQASDNNHSLLRDAAPGIGFTLVGLVILFFARRDFKS